MSYQVKTGIKPPKRYDRYPFADMEIGDSFDQPDVQRGKSLRGVVYQYGRRHNKKFSVRFVDETVGYRVWRIE